MKAAGYLRSARADDQVTEEQQAALRDYAAAHGREVVAWYVDAGISGLVPFSERAAVGQLLQAAAAGEFDRVLVTNWERLGRSAAVLAEARAKLSAAGVRVESVAEGLAPLSAEELAWRRDIVDAQGH